MCNLCTINESCERIRISCPMGIPDGNGFAMVFYAKCVVQFAGMIFQTRSRACDWYNISNSIYGVWNRN